MQPRVAHYGFILIVSCCFTISAMGSRGKGLPRGLKPDEFGAVALIYNQELSILGDRALFPICIGMPPGTPTASLVRYLRKGGFEISDETVCEPSIASGGQHHPKDYPHGLRIFIAKVQHDSRGTMSMQVEVVDLTLRPGEHLGTLLRRGTYRFGQSTAGGWEIVDYEKEYDSADRKAKGKPNCDQVTGAVK